VLPDWDAWMVQVPTATRVSVLPDTVHTLVVVDAKPTARPDVDVALTPKGAAPNALLDSAPKVIIWLA